MPPATPQSAPGVPAPHQPNQADRLFVREAAIGGMTEVELAQLAEQKTDNQAVKELDEAHKTVRSKLETLNGAAFDRAYIQGQVQDHQTTAQLLEWEIGSGQDAQLKSFASETLPTVLQHLQMAQSIAAEMTGQAVPMAASETIGSSRQ